MNTIPSHISNPGRHGKSHKHLTPAERHEQLTQQTEKWVAQTFFGTLMKQMRDSPFKSKLFDGGRGGEMFGAMYDQQLADHMGKSTGQKLVKSLVHKIEGANAYKTANQAYKAAHAADAHQISSHLQRSMP